MFRFSCSPALCISGEEVGMASGAGARTNRPDYQHQGKVIMMIYHSLYQPHILEAAILRVEISFIRSSCDLPHDNVPVQFYCHSSSLSIY